LEIEHSIPLGKRIVNDNMLKVHKTQKRHFEHCMNPQGDYRKYIFDRFNQKRLRRGSNPLESFWRTLRMRFPEHCGLKLGFALLLAITIDYNFMREAQFDSRWAYLPISIQSLCLTQDIAMKGHTSMCQILPLSKSDSTEIFGLPRSYFEAAELGHLEIEVSKEVTAFSELVLEQASFDSLGFDVVAEQLVKEAADSLVKQPTMVYQENDIFDQTTDDKFRTDQRDSTGSDVILKSRTRPEYRGGMKGTNKKKSHKKRHTGIQQLGCYKFSVAESMEIYAKLQRYSPTFNPIERRCFRYFLVRSFGNEIVELEEIELTEVPMQRLIDIWDIFYCSLQTSTHPYAIYIRPKTIKVVKEHLESVITYARFSCTFAINTRGNAKTLAKQFMEQVDKLKLFTNKLNHNAYHVLDSSPADLIEAIQSKGLKEAEKRNDAITAQVACSSGATSSSEIIQSATSESTENVVIDMDTVRVIAEACRGPRRVRWEGQGGAYERLIEEGYAPEKLVGIKRALYNIRHREAVKKTRIEQLDHSQAMPSEADQIEDLQQRQVAQMSSSSTALNNSSQDEPSFTLCSCGFEIPRVTPSIAEIDRQVLVTPSRGTAFTPTENSLYVHIMEHEKRFVNKGKNSIAWGEFWKRWKFWAAVWQICSNFEPQRKMPDIWARSEEQLRQRRKDIQKTRERPGAS